MDALAELHGDDQLCEDGTDVWLSYDQWKATIIPSAPPPIKRTVIRPAAAKATASSAAPPDDPQNSSPERRIERMVEALNDSRRERGHDHPLYFTEPSLIREAVHWLDQHHPGWDAKDNGSQPPVLDHWLIPALATLHSDLVKPMHESAFGNGRTWRLLD